MTEYLSRRTILTAGGAAAAAGALPFAACAQTGAARQQSAAAAVQRLQAPVSRWNPASAPAAAACSMAHLPVMRRIVGAGRGSAVWERQAGPCQPESPRHAGRMTRPMAFAAQSRGAPATPHPFGR